MTQLGYPYPDDIIEIAFASQPLSTTQTYSDVTSKLRQLATRRGRSYEFDRMEAGTADYTLDNRTGDFNPENTAGIYYPNVKPTRRFRRRFRWNGVVYDWFVGFTKGYPQEYPSTGYDAVVRQQSTDFFYALNTARFRPGSTTLGAAIVTSPAVDTVETITVAANVLPMPRALPFIITIDSEQMQVTAYPTPTTYTVKRGQNSTTPTIHANGVTVSTLIVSFEQELSGTRIGNVLTRLGFAAADQDLDTGQALIAATDNLAGSNPLEHLLTVAEAENGRFFAAKSGKLTFLDRNYVFTNEKTARATFGTAAGHIPYQLTGAIDHDESKLYNVVRITPSSGNTVEVRDQTSIDDHLERVLEKTWPLASDNEARAAAEYLLSRSKDIVLRVPTLKVNPGESAPATLWPIVLSMEIGQRYAFQYDPKGGGDTITKELILDGLGEESSPKRRTLTVELVPADTAQYWQLGVAGSSELGVTTYLAY